MGRTAGPARPPPASAFKGLAWDKKDGTWRVRISLMGKQHHLGRYADELEAAQVFDCAALLLFGEAAAVNLGADRARERLPQLLQTQASMQAIEQLAEQCRAAKAAVHSLISTKVAAATPAPQQPGAGGSCAAAKQPAPPAAPASPSEDADTSSSGSRCSLEAAADGSGGPSLKQQRTEAPAHAVAGSYRFPVPAAPWSAVPNFTAVAVPAGGNALQAQAGGQAPPPLTFGGASGSEGGSSGGCFPSWAPRSWGWPGQSCGTAMAMSVATQPPPQPPPRAWSLPRQQPRPVAPQAAAMAPSASARMPLPQAEQLLISAGEYWAGGPPASHASPTQTSSPEQPQPPQPQWLAVPPQGPAPPRPPTMLAVPQPPATAPHCCPNYSPSLPQATSGGPLAPPATAWDYVEDGLSPPDDDELMLSTLFQSSTAPLAATAPLAGGSWPPAAADRGAAPNPNYALAAAFGRSDAGPAGGFGVCGCGGSYCGSPDCQAALFQMYDEWNSC